MAAYWHLAIDGVLLRDGGWSYPNPTTDFVRLRDHVAFYAAPLDHCTIDGEQVRPQPGGWIAPDLAGPFKGVPGSMAW